MLFFFFYLVLKGLQDTSDEKVHVTRMALKQFHVE